MTHPKWCIVQQKAGKKHNHIKIIKVNGIKQAFLFQDMFPIVEKYIKNPYIKQKTFMEIKDPKRMSAIEDNAKDIIKLMRHGVKFTPTQPDSIRIESLMMEEFLYFFQKQTKRSKCSFLAYRSLK